MIIPSNLRQNDHPLFIVSAVTVEWTPFILVATYLVSSTAIWMYCPPALVKAVYIFLMAANSYVALGSSIEAWVGMSLIRKAKTALLQVQRNDFQFPTPDDQLPTIDILFSAYLPNEKNIVKGQLLHALRGLKYPKDKLRIWLIYNTPTPIEPLETELKLMEKEHSKLHILKVPGSTSKAENLTHFFASATGADIYGLFDCDHFLHSYNPRWAAERFLSEGSAVDIVQGRCVVYNSNKSFMAKMIGLEFDQRHGLTWPGRSLMFGFGLFHGSNGYWRAKSIKGLGMDGDMLTEDVDSAFRAYSEGMNAVHDMNVISYEMAPTYFAAYWTQRMRWAQGWTQISMRHISLIWTNPPAPKPPRGMNERNGLFSILLFREVSYHLVAQHLLLLLGTIIADRPHTVGDLIHLLFFRYSVAGWFTYGT